MSAVDVRALADESLPSGKFPADSHADFRLYLAPDARQGMRQHAREDTSVEICGVIVGLWKRDEDGPFAEATDFIRCRSADSKFAEVTFTHESWAQINGEMDSKFADQRILGWYHSHPDFGIFLSDRDVFIHENFFSAPGQIAYVIDPVRDLEGAFAWRDGKPELLPHFWGGADIITAQQAERPLRNDGAAANVGEATARSLAEPPGVGRNGDPLGLATTLLTWLAVFLLGYSLAGWRTRWEQNMIVEGAVAHYGYNKLLRFGLDDRLQAVRAQLADLSAAAQKLPEPNAKLTDEQAATAAKLRSAILSGFAVVQQSLKSTELKYCFTDAETAMLARLVPDRIEQLLEQPPGAPRNVPEAGAAPTDSPPAGPPPPADAPADTDAEHGARSTRSAAAPPGESPSDAPTE